MYSTYPVYLWPNHKSDIHPIYVPLQRIIFFPFPGVHPLKHLAYSSLPLPPPQLSNSVLHICERNVSSQIISGIWIQTKVYEQITVISQVDYFLLNSFFLSNSVMMNSFYLLEVILLCIYRTRPNFQWRQVSI